jgi:signal transduction histidine kinase
VTVLAWLRPPRHLFLLFAAGTVIPSAALIWLGWKVIEQDRGLERQYVQERLEATVDRVASALGQELASIGRSLAQTAGEPVAIPGSTVARFNRAGLERVSGAPLVFAPDWSEASDATRLVALASAEAHEYAGDFAAAAREYRTLAASSNEAVRAVARIRLAANLRKLGRADEALDVYRSLSDTTIAWVAGEPADLVARMAECRLLAELGRTSELGTRAAGIASELANGRWRVERATLESHFLEVSKWTRVPDIVGAMAVADAVQTFWMTRPGAGTAARNAGYRNVQTEGRSVLLFWHTAGDRVTVLAAPAGNVHAAWRRIWSGERASVAFTDTEGRLLAGDVGGRGGPAAVRIAADTGLPWTLRLSATEWPAEAATFAARRRLIAVGLMVLVILIPAGGFIVYRAVQKQLAAARLQADFVSAVSHEFRTPLTAMAHLTERLQRDETISGARRRQYYDVLAGDIDRLKRFVESLLDFGRMEAGTATLRLEPADLPDVVSGIVDDFKARPEAGRHPIQMLPAGPLPPVRLDKETFGRALWNLLDNAAKYSPEESPIRIEIVREDGRAAVHVRDEGQGVRPEHRRQIFKKFVRGDETRSSGVRGTGVGLALVREIARAHGGEVRLTTEVGRGSTFSLLVPLT